MKQTERRVEHYLELYSTESTVSEEALNSIQYSQPTASEIKKTINDLANGKAPGNDVIPPEVIKQGIPVPLPIYMNFFPSAGEKVNYLGRCVMPRLSLYLRIKVIAVIVTTIVESPSEAFLAKCLHELFLPDYRYWQIVYIQNLSVALDQEDPLLI